MKRGFVFGVLFLVLITSLVFAQSEPPSATQNDAPNAATQLKEEIKNIPDTSGVKEKSNEVLAKEIQIPEKLQLAARIIFGLKEDETIDLQTFIVLISIWLILFFLIHSILEITPFFEGWKSFVGGFIVTTLIAISGAIKEVSIFFFGFGSLFGKLQDWGIFKLFFSLILLALLFYGAFRLLKFIKKKTDFAQAEKIGTDIAIERAVAKTAREMYRSQG